MYVWTWKAFLSEMLEAWGRLGSWMEREVAMEFTA
jgi:hypothetical protein